MTTKSRKGVVLYGVDENGVPRKILVTTDGKLVWSSG